MPEIILEADFLQQRFRFLWDWGRGFSVIISCFLRYETAAAQLVVLEIVNCPYAVFLVFNNYIVELFSQYRFDRRFLFRRNSYVIGDYAVKLATALLRFDNRSYAFVSPFKGFLKFSQRIKPRVFDAEFFFYLENIVFT